MKKSREKRKAKGGFDQDDLDAYAQKRKQQKHVTAVSVLNAEADGSYRPKTRETRAAYEALLGMIGAAKHVLRLIAERAANHP